jgi:hypothetical protein
MFEVIAFQDVNKEQNIAHILERGVLTTVW